MGAPDWVDVFPTKKLGFSSRHVSLPEGNTFCLDKVLGNEDDSGFAWYSIPQYQQEIHNTDLADRERIKYVTKLTNFCASKSGILIF